MAKKKVKVEEPKIQSWLDDLSDPDNVGQSEYRIIHDLLNELDFSNAEDEAAKISLAEAVLEEVEGWAKNLARSLAQFKAGKAETFSMKPSTPGPDKLKYRVLVSRSCPQLLTIPVLAKNDEEAKELALDKAPDLDFANGTSVSEAEYDVESVEKVD